MNPPYHAELKEKARKLRKQSTLSEVLLWQEIKNKKLGGYKFSRQRGDSHDTKQEYDAKRDEYLRSLGLKVLHFYDLDVKLNISSVVYEIEKELKKTC